MLNIFIKNRSQQRFNFNPLKTPQTENVSRQKNVALLRTKTFAMKIKFFLFLVVIFFSSQSFVQLLAKEDWVKFLEALEDRQYYEEALNYLNSFSNDPNIDPRLKRELPDRIARIQQKMSGKNQISSAPELLSYKNVHALSDSDLQNEKTTPDAFQPDLSGLKQPNEINNFYEAVEQCNILFAALIKLNTPNISNSSDVPQSSDAQNSELSDELNSETANQKRTIALKLEQTIRIALDFSERPETRLEEQKKKNKTALREKSDKPLDTLIENLRFQWAYLSLTTERNEDAIILGNYLVQNNETFPNIISAAEITLQACKNLYMEIQNNPNLSQEEKEKSFQFVNSQIAEFTGFIFNHWSPNDSPEKKQFIQKALLLRINSAISSNDIEEAQQFLQEIPDSSDLKATGELRLGLALWMNWLENVQDSEKKQNISDESENDNEAIDNVSATIDQQTDLLEKAQKFLNQGLRRKIEVNNGLDSNDYLSSYSALTLANILFLQNESQTAWEWLNHPSIGPYQLVLNAIQASLKEDSAIENIDSTENAATSPNAETNPSNNSPDFLDDSFKTKTLILALRLFIHEQSFDKAEETVNQLESFYSKNESELAFVYLQIGKQLEDQIRQLSQTDDKEQLTKITTAFELFLDRLSQKSNENDYMTLRWIGDTYMSFGKGLTGSLIEPSPEAQHYFTKAGRIYQTIRKKIKQDAQWAKIENAETATVLRLSQCLCAVGLQEKALPLLVELLEQSENVLELQIEAANVYQKMGRKNNENYIRAIVGEYKKENGQNLIWGWNGIIYRISRKINNQPELSDYFYESMTNKMFCRYSYIRTLNDKNEIQKQAQNAEKELLRLQQTYPNLGGINWKNKFEAQLKQFRRLQGQTAPQGF